MYTRPKEGYGSFVLVPSSLEILLLNEELQLYVYISADSTSNVWQPIYMAY